MDEAEWLVCEDSQPMLVFLRDLSDDRRWQLFACACCRRIWHLIGLEQSRQAIEIAERYADGGATTEELEEAASAVSAVPPEDAATFAVCCAAFSGPNVWDLDHVAQSYAYSVNAVRDANPGNRRAAGEAEQLAQAILLRDIFGNPFRPVALTPAWRTPTVLALTQAAYEERTLPAGTLEPDRLAILADALEDAGCDQAELLGHLRGPGVHVRGCWAVDLVLGKG